MSIPGVPALPPGLGGVLSDQPTQLLTSDAPAIAAGQMSIWGIYQQNTLTRIITPDSIFSFDLRKEFRVPTYPVEQGGFQSYNKVQTPFDARVVMTKGGKVDDRAAFLTQIEQIVADTNLYDIYTPEKKYFGANIVHYEYRRTAEQGQTLLMVELGIVEIRNNTSSPSFQNTAQPSGEDPISIGTVQTTVATSPQAAVVSSVT